MSSGLYLAVPTTCGISGATTTNFAPSTTFSLFLKVPALPTTDTTIFDFDMGCTGWWRARLTPTGRYLVEFRWGGSDSNHEPTTSTYLIQPGFWYYLYSSIRNQTNQNFASYSYLNGNPLSYGLGAWGGAVGSNNVPTCFMPARFGLGQSLSSAYANFPNTAGWELSKVQLRIGNGTQGDYGLGGPIGADPSPQNGVSQNGGTIALYLARDAQGAASTIVNSAAQPGPLWSPQLTAQAGSTALAAGSYTVGYTYLFGSNETQLGPTSAVTLTAGQQVSANAFYSNIQLPPFATGINWYMSIAAGSSTLGLISSQSVAWPGPGITTTTTLPGNPYKAQVLTVVGSGVRPPVNSTATGLFNLNAGTLGVTVNADGPYA